MTLQERLVGFLYRKYRKLTLPPDLRHMAAVSPYFRLQQQDDGGHEILWRGRRLGQTHPLSQLTGSCRGPAWIVGSGPSMANIDLARLPAGHYLALNGAISLHGKGGLRFRDLMVIDTNFAENRLGLIRDGVAAGCRCLFTFPVVHAISRIDPGILAQAEIYLIEELRRPYHRAAPAPSELGEGFVNLDPSRVTGFSLRPDIAFYDGGTVAYAALQVLCYLGARQIRFLGFDLSADQRQPRFYEQGEDALPCWLDLDYRERIEPSFRLARRLCDERGIELLNATPTSRLPGDIMAAIDVAEFYQ